jgi:hypothetical protein
MRRFGVAFVALAVFLGGACSRPAEPTPKPGRAPLGIVLVTVDSIRPDQFALFGGTLKLRNIERIAEGATVYEDAATVCPMSRPSLATILTGVAPDRSGVRDDVTDRLPGNVPTLAELHRAAGRVTAAFVTTPFASIHSGLDRGFDVFDGPEESVVGPGRYFPKVVSGGDAALHFTEWVRGLPPSTPYFAWIHLSDLHGESVEGEPGMEGATYPEGLAKIDGALAVIVDFLDREKRTPATEILLVGTHGDHLGEGGRRGGTFWLSRETLRVPLIWKKASPNTVPPRPPEKTARRVWLPDVAATLAALAGGRLDARAEGVDLEKPDTDGSDRMRFSWTWAPDDQVAWPTLTALDGRDGLSVFEWPQRPPARPATPRVQALPDDVRARIAASGVTLGGASVPPVPPVASRDAFLVELQRLQQAFTTGRVLRRGKILREFRVDVPENLAALAADLFLTQSRGDAELSRKLAERILKLYPNRQEALHWAAHVALLDRDMRKADALLRGASALGPSDPDVLYDLACTAALSGDRDRAIASLRSAIDAGFRDWEWIERDVDLASLRADARYSELMKAHGR